MRQIVPFLTSVQGRGELSAIGTGYLYPPNGLENSLPQNRFGKYLMLISGMNPDHSIVKVVKSMEGRNKFQILVRNLFRT